MEIKHTIEILTKDIQDIEKLVRNLKNYPAPPKIELDLAMDKMRKVYDLLAMIADDANEVKSTLAEPEAEGMPEMKDEVSQTPTEPEAEVLPEMKDEARQVPVEPEAEVLPEMKDDILEMDTDSDTAEEVSRKDQVIDAAEEVSQAEGVSDPVEQPSEEPKKESNAGATQLEINTETANVPSTEPTTTKTNGQSAEKKASILAEKFASNASLNEKIAPKGDNAIASKVSGEPIDSIRRNIGINDRFMIIRELLNGENELYDSMVQQLDSCNNFNESFKLLESRFPDKLEHEGVQMLINLSRRKFISSGNV